MQRIVKRGSPKPTAYEDELSRRTTQEAQRIGLLGRDFLTISEAARWLNLSDETLRRYRAKGVGPVWTLKGSGRAIYPLRNLLAYRDQLEAVEVKRRQRNLEAIERSRPMTQRRIMELRRRQKAQADE